MGLTIILLMGLELESIFWYPEKSGFFFNKVAAGFSKSTTWFFHRFHSQNTIFWDFGFTVSFDRIGRTGFHIDIWFFTGFFSNTVIWIYFQQGGALDFNLQNYILYSDSHTKSLFFQWFIFTLSFWVLILDRFKGRVKYCCLSSAVQTAK